MFTVNRYAHFKFVYNHVYALEVGFFPIILLDHKVVNFLHKLLISNNIRTPLILLWFSFIFQSSRWFILYDTQV